MIKIEEFGRSMVEMLGVLAIIGVLSAAGLAGYSKAVKKNKLNKATEQISMIISNLTNNFINEEDYSALGKDRETATIRAIALKVFPPEMIQEDGVTVLNPYKGRVYVYSVDYGGVEDGAFNIDYEGLPSEVAISFAIPQTNVENQMMMNVNINPESSEE